MAKKKSVKKPALGKDEKIIKEEFDSALQLSRHSTASLKHIDAAALTKQVINRKKSAVLAYMGQAKERYGILYPHLEIEREWAKENAVQSMSADSADHFCHITLASAIWMLDTLKGHYLLQDAYQYFSRNNEELESVRLPDFFDPCHDKSVICGMVQLIHDRDGKTKHGQHYMTEASALRRSSSPPERTSAASEEIQTDHELSGRERFDAVMGMIPSALKECAVRRFEAKIWDFFDRYFCCVSKYAKEQTEAEQEEAQLRSLLMAAARNAGASLRESSFALTASPVAAPLNKGPASAPLPLANTSLAERHALLKTEKSSSLDKAYGSVLDLTNRGVECKKKLQELESKRMSLSFAAHIAPIMQRSELEKDHCPDVAHRLQGLSVDDPYESCFAYLCLLDQGSDLPWLCNAATAVLLAAARKLPWFAVPDAVADADDGKEDPLSQDDRADEPEEAAFDGRTHSDAGGMDCNDKIAKLYELNYSDAPLYFPFEETSSHWNVNLPQLMFGLTGIIMPRTVPMHDERINEFVAAGMDPGMASAMELYLRLAIEVQSLSKSRESELLAERFHQIMESLGFEDNDEDASEDVSVEELHEQLRKLKSQNDELKKALYLATKEAEQGKANIARTNLERAAEQQELYDLRELIFNQTNDIDTAEEASESDIGIQWPYVSKKRAVVFGGHETWLKAVRPLLPNVVFARSQNPNTDLIRNADIVWIQTNAMSHKSFYKIINITRAYHIPVRYFGYASAKKCAVQLVQDDTTGA